MSEAMLMQTNLLTIIELLARNESLEELLTALCQAIESQTDGTLASILLYNAASRQLMLGAAPKLPKAYNQAIQGLTIGPAVGSCGTAAFRRELVVVEDIETDPLWREYSHAVGLALRHGLRSCWSQPILSAGGELLGTFALYHREKRKPTQAELGLIAQASHLASLAIERRRAEDRLQESQERLKFALEGANDGLWDWDIPRDHMYYSPRWAGMLGYEVEELPPTIRTWEGLLHPDDRDQIQQEVRDNLSGRKTHYQVEFRLRSKNGTWRWILARGNVVTRDAEGHPLRAVGTHTDITDRVQAEIELRRAKNEAECASQSKSRFLAAASHDLRQPLQGLLLFSALLTGHVASAKGREILAHMTQSLNAMKELLDSLLDISRLESGVVQPVFEDFAVQEFLDEIAAAFTPIAAAKGLDFDIVPVGAGTVRSDRMLLGRMVRNLVENAIRYTSAGGIRIEAHRTDGQLRLEVRDTGIGIPPDHLDRIWEEFHQVGNPERNRAQGLGLGLAIVQRLSRLLDHPVEVSSHPGRGSVFSIEVPVSTKGPARAPVSVPIASGKGQFAVLVEDDPLVLRGLQTTLEDWGYKVLAASSADQALEQLCAAGRPPGVVIADYHLGGGRSGIEAVLQIRTLFGGDIPGIILTGATGPDSACAAACHGLAVLHKPVTPQTLNAVLEEKRWGLRVGT